MDILPFLPNCLVSWDVADPGAGTFLKYRVKRRTPQVSMTWTTLSVITDQATLRYVDYACPPNSGVQYAITQVVDIAGEQLESEEEPVDTVLCFNWAYLHAMSDPTVWCPLYSFDMGQSSPQDAELLQARGRTAPTLFVGRAQWVVTSVRALEAQYRVGDLWTRLRALQTEQGPDGTGSLLCLRMGKAADRRFVQMTGLSRSLGQASFNPDVVLTEVHGSDAAS